MNWCQLNELDRYIENLAVQYEQKLCSLAFNKVGNTHEAEEIVQRAMVRLYEMLRRHPSKQISNPYGYLCRIVDNLCKDILKEKMKNVTIPLSYLQERRTEENQRVEPFDVEDISPHHQPQIVAESNEGEKKILEEVSAIPNYGIRSTIQMHLQGYSTQEISQQLQQPDGTTRGNRSKGLQHLRARLTDSQDNGQSLDNSRY